MVSQTMENLWCNKNPLPDMSELAKFLSHAYREEKYFLLRNVFGKKIFSWEDLDETLFSWEFNDDIKVFYDGSVPFEKYIEKYSDFGKIKYRIIKHEFYNYIESGASIVLNRIQNRSRIINDLCRYISQITEAPTNANAYAARGGDGTFDMHWDSHDVFAVQLIGKKRWRIYAPTFEKPLPHQKSSAYKSFRPKEPVADIILEQGDILYIPRGWWHEAIPLESQETFHIAIGVFPIKVIDFLQWILSIKLSEVLEGREYLNSFDQDIIKKATDSFGEMTKSLDNYNEFLLHYQSGIRMKSNFNTSVFFEDKKTFNNNAFYNGIFPTNHSFGTLINGINIKKSEDNFIFKESLYDANRKINLSPLDSDIARNLYKMDIIS